MVSQSVMTPIGDDPLSVMVSQSVMTPIGNDPLIQSVMTCCQ
jgi:hypothetical protein